MNARGFGIVLLAFGMLLLSGCGRSDDSTESPEEAIATEMNRRDKAQEEMEDMKALRDRMKDGYLDLLDAKDKRISELEQENSDLRNAKKDVEEKYVASKIVCIGLGAAVVGALFLGTLMGAKGRRDALRASNDRNTPTEVVV